MPSSNAQVKSGDQALTIAHLREAGCDLPDELTVWIVDPKERRVYVYRSPTRIEKLGPADVLIVEDFLPGLRIPVEDLFEE